MEIKKSNDIGMKRGRVLSVLPSAKLLDVIAEGLPILMKSAGEYLAASKILFEHHPRVAKVLKGHAVEEVAKILILIDIVRCPPKCRPSRIGPMMRWFYSHLARLLYVDAQACRPTNARELQEYVDLHRKSHYIDGELGEYIMPNSALWLRESMLYTDIVTYEDGEPFWNEPITLPSMFGYDEPSSWLVCQVLQDLGAFTRDGLDIMSSIWCRVLFKDDEDWRESRSATEEMLTELQNASLIRETATQKQGNILYEHWQIPMYYIDFNPEKVKLEDLKAAQDAIFWSQVGY